MVGLDAIAAPSGETEADRLSILSWSDRLGLAFCPMEEGVATWDDRDDVSLGLPFPLAAALGAELEIALSSNLMSKMRHVAKVPIGPSLKGRLSFVELVSTTGTSAPSHGEGALAALEMKGLAPNEALKCAYLLFMPAISSRSSMT